MVISGAEGSFARSGKTGGIGGSSAVGEPSPTAAPPDPLEESAGATTGEPVSAEGTGDGAGGGGIAGEGGTAPPADVPPI